MLRQLYENIALSAAEYAIGIYNALIAQCRDAGFLVQHNHPYWSLNTREDCLALENLWALEILNWATQRETGAGYRPYIYDDMLRKNGPPLFCTMDDDNHKPPCFPPEEHSLGGVQNPRSGTLFPHHRCGRPGQLRQHPRLRHPKGMA